MSRDLEKEGPSVPPKGRYSIKVFAEALGIDIPIEHPSAEDTTRAKQTKKTRRAPPILSKFLQQIETIAADENVTAGKRLFCSLICLQVFASLRYVDTTQVSGLWLSNAALVGTSIDTKDRDGGIMTWATPLSGTLGVKWSTPLMEYWKVTQPAREDVFVPLFPSLLKIGRSKLKELVQPGQYKRHYLDWRRN